MSDRFQHVGKPPLVCTNRGQHRVFVLWTPNGYWGPRDRNGVSNIKMRGSIAESVALDGDRVTKQLGNPMAPRYANERVRTKYVCKECGRSYELRDETVKKYVRRWQLIPVDKRPDVLDVSYL